MLDLSEAFVRPWELELLTVGQFYGYVAGIKARRAAAAQGV